LRTLASTVDVLPGIKHRGRRSRIPRLFRRCHVVFVPWRATIFAVANPQFSVRWPRARVPAKVIIDLEIPSNHLPAVREFVIPGNLRVTVPANPALMTPFVLDEQGDWFEGEMHFVRSLLTPGMAVVDVGANYGLYTLTCAGLVGSEGRVWAYEPAALPRDCLARSISANGLSQAHLMGKALSDRTGTARLGIAANAELNSLNEQGQAGETVPLSTLDIEALGWDRRIDFLKLDAEGEELRILAGAQRFFAEHDPLVMFEHKHGAIVNHGLTQAFKDLGMSVYRHVPGLNVLVPLPNVDGADPFLLNIFGCRAERASRLREQGRLVSTVAALAPPPTRDEAMGIVTNWFRERAWARCLWPGGLPASDPPGADLFIGALADLIESETPVRPADERWARQQRGYASLKQAIAVLPTVPRLFSASRVAMDLGERAASVAMLEQAGGRLNGGPIDPATHWGEFFLPPHRRHDDLDPGAASGATVMQVMLDEPYLERCAFSIYFVADRVAPLLRRIAANPLRSPAIKRRLAAAEKVIRF
jgi:FkbM family methyltransferase